MLKSVIKQTINLFIHRKQLTCQNNTEIDDQSHNGSIGGCPRIVIFSQIEECEKNYRRYIVDIPRIIF